MQEPSVTRISGVKIKGDENNLTAAFMSGTEP